MVAPLYALLRGRLPLQNALLLLASYVFYAWWEWRYVPLLLFSTCVDYWVAQRIEATEAPASRRRWVALSCAANLGLLGFFKYWDFFARSGNGLAGALGLEGALPELDILLPIGISFYTFQSMAYTIEVHRKHFPAWRSFLEFATYVSFFPQLVAGPIERPQRLLRAIAATRRVRASDVEQGLTLFAMGWLLKSAADVLATVADPVFGAPREAGAWSLLWGVYAFAFQLYCDFFGYTQMARGVAKLLGFDLMENFATPYFSANPAEFWRRWHISLSTWLRDYLYISLGGSRRTRARTLRNLLITMTLGGLWHGAAWGFVVWGVLHGVWLVLHRWLYREGSGPRIPKPLAVFATFHLVCVGWIFFRAQDTAEAGALANALHHLGGLLALPLAAWEAPPLAFAVTAIPLFFDGLQRATGESQWTRGMHWALRGVALGLLITLASVLGSEQPRAFVYFQF